MRLWKEEYAPQNGIHAGSTTNQMDRGVQEYAIDKHFSNWVPQRGVRGSERDKCVMVEEFYWLS
jgi:hypothetical protein